MVTDSLSKIETIRFKKDVSGFEKFKNYLEYYLYKINIDIKKEKNPITLIELNRLKKHIELDIEHTNKRIEMIK